MKKVERPRRCMLSAQRWMHADSGAVTAEFAVVLPAVVLVALILLSLGRAVVVRVECQDGARAAAREISVSQVYNSAAQQRAEQAAMAVSPNATVSFETLPAGVGISLSCGLLPGPLGIFPLSLHGEAVALRQDDA